MANYSQANRPIRVDTVLGEDVLLLERVTGEEHVSAPFRFTLDLLSENASIGAKSVLGTAATVTLELAEGGERVIHGRVSRFAQLGREPNGLTTYRAELVPWLWFLSLSSDCRVYQNLSVVEIAEQVFHESHFSSLKPEFQVKCLKSYPKREYCVQYRESYLNFVSRLLEEEGIFYHFEHTKQKHTLVLTDSSSTLRFCQGEHAVRMSPTTGEGVHDRNSAFTLLAEQAAGSSEIRLRDYNPLTPSVDLSAEITCEPPFAVGSVFDYPGKFDAKEDADRYAGLRASALEAQLTMIRGTSNARALQSGTKFDLKEHYRRDLNASYQLISVRHAASIGAYRNADDAELDYTNEFTALPDSVKYHPPLVARKPVVHGSQPAVVVGKAGEEIWVDKYGRVKVHFFWDRYGQKNEQSSCWVRVSSVWAGKGWGGVQIPRIGQEVLVDFLEGDPDRPIITGRVYNAEQMPPYTLPANQTQSGIKSRSTKGGAADNFNEIRFEDKKGSEELYIHAEKDKTVVVKHNRTETVGGDESITISGSRTESVGKNESITIGEARTENVGKGETVTIGEDRTTNVGGKESTSIGKDESLDVGGARTKNVGKSETINVSDNRSATVGKNDQLSVGKKLVIDAGDEITITTGSASISMKKNGDITIKGNNITIEGSGKINVKASSDVVIKGSKVTAN
jgi:type VI secretion system secreted protein VgrG